MSRIQAFFDNVAANFVSWILICSVCAVGGIVVALFAAATHGLSRAEQASIVGLSSIVLMALVAIIYVAIRARKLRASAGLPAGMAGIPSAEAFGKGGGVTLQPMQEALAARNEEVRSLKKQLDEWHWDLLAKQDVRAELSPTGDKVTMILRNSTGEEIQVWTPLWESTEVQAFYPLITAIQLEADHLGWKAGAWQEEKSCASIPGGRTFKCSIGLLQPSGDGIKERINHKTLGTAIFPVKIRGKLYKARVGL